MFVSAKRTLATVAALAAATIGLGFSANKADASTGCQTLRNGYTICTVDNGHYGSDAIGVWTPSDYRVATMNVICTGGGGNRWEANRDSRYVSYNDLSTIANWWCANY